ncbi:LOW QUALITY PROTEIN: platelet endothelial cell adhesion molecule [Hypomesus transpacificus]|uniref:LOW QUALITY PROTEIN: platelet endothelial cell adhesion molecule n=1 Tax=Hypomesus transpacificus TaxID=137520 RepID=UPI001F075259|nr:LOW QUALITY PROTEIN: platelet endothelial cell adhesion molecule [Hypomesus transpacificus]
MGSLLLLFFFSVLGSSTCQQAEGLTLFTLENVTLSIEPDGDVERDASPTLRCRPLVKSSPGTSLVRRYVVLKDNAEVHHGNTSRPDDLLWSIPNARVSDSGKYKCRVFIRDKTAVSNTEKLKVTGLSQPVLLILRNTAQAPIQEGDRVPVSCQAPGETGTFIFYFYDQGQEIHEEQTTSNQVEVELLFNKPGMRDMQCAYMVLMVPDAVKSNHSQAQYVRVREFDFLPVLSVLPDPTKTKIFEGDRINVSCEYRGAIDPLIRVALSNGNQLLDVTQTQAKVSHSLTVFSNHSGEFECSVMKGNVVKKRNSIVKVLEIISTPTLTVNPDVFENDTFHVRCQSDVLAPERVDSTDVNYQIRRIEGQTSYKEKVFRDLVHTAGSRTYTCTVTARNIVKHSPALVVQIKALASEPQIWAVGRVVVGRPFQVRCHSARGSLPITHTLQRNKAPVGTVTITRPGQLALFNVTIQRAGEIHDYSCSSQNNRHVLPVVGKHLNISVVVPLSDPRLSVLPALSDILEGVDLILICSAEGSPPITFRWYRDDSAKSLHSSTSADITDSHVIHGVDKQASGAYYCEAVNYDNVNIRSQKVIVEVKTATWKKGLIVASCLLMVALVVLLCVLRFRAKRGKRDTAAELSVKPSSPKPDDSLTVSLTHDTEVYDATTVRVDGAGTSVWSERSAHPGSDEESSAVSSEPDVEYTEVVHPRPMDPARVPLRKGTDTVYSELQNSPTGLGDLDHHDYGSVEYASLNTEQPELNHNQPQLNHHDLPVPVD